MRRTLTAAGIVLGTLLTLPQSSSATAFEDFVAALSRGDMVAMRAVVAGNQDELVRDFYLLLREAGSILDRSPYDPEERNKARLLVFAATQLAQTFDDVGPGQDVLVRLVRDSPLLTVTVRSEVDSDAALARYLSQRTADLASFGGAPGLARDLLSLFEAAAEPPEVRLRREMEAAIAEQRRQQELRELTRRVGRLRQARDADGLQAIATDGSLSVLARRSAVRSLGEIGSPRAVAALDRVLHDAELQEYAMQTLVALGKLGEPGGSPAIAILIRRLDEPGAAAAAGEALGQIGAPVFPALLRRSEQPGPGRRIAAATLAATGYRPRSPREEARLLLVRGKRFGLMRLGPSALPVLTAAARGRDAETAAVARVVLGFELGLVLAVVALSTLWLRRGWIWPGTELEVTAGGKARVARGLWKTHRRPVEMGTILHTAWARDTLGRRRRIKMEVLASMGTAPRGEPPGTAFDVLVAAGASVAPGTYLAVAPAGSVKIRVTPSS